MLGVESSEFVTESMLQFHAYIPSRKGNTFSNDYRTYVCWVREVRFVGYSAIDQRLVVNAFSDNENPASDSSR